MLGAKRQREIVHMISQQAVGWFSLGFLVGAAVTYGVAMGHASWVKVQAIMMMNDAIKKIERSTEIAKEALITEQKYGDLQDKHLALLTEYNDLGAEYKDLAEELLAERNEYGEFLRKYEVLLINHKELLRRTGGEAEGTA